MRLRGRLESGPRGPRGPTLTLRPVDRVRPGASGPALFLNPTDDAEFVAEVDRAMGEGIADAADLQRRLRATYPHALVRPRGLANEPFVVWYVYRDGHWVPSV
jgi:hypothetical protein